TIFGGVILSQIDLAAGVEAFKVAPHLYVTKAMREVEFHEPVYTGDLVSFFPALVRVGRTSVTIRVEVEAERWGWDAAKRGIVRDALDFPIPLVKVTGDIHALELFHGPTLAFKDVGARTQARLLHHFTDGTPLTILVATSGDTGSAVAQAFHGVPDTRVVVLYPEGKVSDVQEAQMASLGDNITAVAVHGTFDDCQWLVKQAFADDDLRSHVWLT